MLAVGLFAKDAPSGERNETTLRRVSQGTRLEKPEGAEDLGLTSQMWELIENCTVQDPKRRPKTQDLVKRWGRFVGSADDPRIAFKYVQRFYMTDSTLYYILTFPWLT